MNNLLQTFRRLGPVRLSILGAVLVALIAFFTFITTELTTPGYGLLYSDLDLKDSSQLVTKLETMGVPYHLKGDGSSIYVPTDQVARARLAMAEIGIPHGGSIGYELFDKSDALGSTNFQQGINEMRALEGELGRTIQSLSMVESARVHLVLPKRELFSRDTQEPSASIVLKTRGAGPLPKPQIAAILNLVASAVPGLKPTRISIIDQAGNLLARGNGDNPDSLTPGSSAEEQRVAYETQLAQNVEEMLERSLGYGHVRVDVNADMDFDRVTTSQETYDPDGQVVRSTQSNNELNESDQPQSQEQPATVQNNLPGGQQTQQANNAAAAVPKSKDNKQEETTNYEISKKVVSQVREAGVVKRLSVAVLVDGNYATDKGVKSYQPRSADEIAALTKLVQSAIGFDEKRGDRVEVIGMKFAEAADADSGSAAIFLGLDKADLFRIGEAAGLLLLALVALLFVVRPLLNRLVEPGQRIEPQAQNLLPAPGAMAALPPPAGMEGDAPQTGTLVPVDGDAMIDISQVEGRVRASSMKKIGEIVEKHPEEAVAILRNWMYQST